MGRDGWGEEAAKDIIHVVHGFYWCPVQIKTKCSFVIISNAHFLRVKMLMLK